MVFFFGDFVHKKKGIREPFQLTPVISSFQDFFLYAYTLFFFISLSCLYKRNKFVYKNIYMFFFGLAYLSNIFGKAEKKKHACVIMFSVCIF